MQNDVIDSQLVFVCCHGILDTGGELPIGSSAAKFRPSLSDNVITPSSLSSLSPHCLLQVYHNLCKEWEGASAVA